jgi:hypothetical protein
MGVRHNKTKALQRLFVDLQTTYGAKILLKCLCDKGFHKWCIEPIQAPIIYKLMLGVKYLEKMIWMSLIPMETKLHTLKVYLNHSYKLSNFN